MTKPWEVIEQALARKKPPRGPKWLADELGEKIQVVSNWKSRGVPMRRFRQIAEAIGITVDQLEGLQPLPWERIEAGTDWPFSESLKRKVLILSDEELYRLETVMRAHLGMDQTPMSVVANNRQIDTAKNPSQGHHRAPEEGVGLPEDVALPPTPKQHDRSSQDRRRAPPKGRRGA